jgi:hypothetical protein
MSDHDSSTVPEPPSEEHYLAALEVARWLVERTTENNPIEGGTVDVEIVVGNPIVKEYTIKVKSPGS